MLLSGYVQNIGINTYVLTPPAKSKLRAVCLVRSVLERCVPRDEEVGEGSPLLTARRPGPSPSLDRLDTLLADPLLHGGAYSLFEFVANFPPRSLYLRGGYTPPAQELPTLLNASA
jgi:hypothetical protein